MVISATHYLLFDENVSTLQNCSCNSCENVVGILFPSLKANICHFYNSCQTTLREIPVLRIEKMYFCHCINGESTDCLKKKFFGKIIICELDTSNMTSTVIHGPCELQKQIKSKQHSDL